VPSASASNGTTRGDSQYQSEGGCCWAARLGLVRALSQACRWWWRGEVRLCGGGGGGGGNGWWWMYT